MKKDGLAACDFRSLVELTFGASVQIGDLPADTEVTVRTESGSEYELYVLEPEARKVVVSGGIFGDDSVEATVMGSVVSPECSTLHHGWIKVGFSLEIAFDRRKYAGHRPPICTSPVREILLNGRKLKPRKRES